MIKVSLQKQLFGADKEILLDVNFSIKKGEFVALSGVSGSGKTTLLRILAGLEDAKGFLKVDGKIWQDEKIFLPPHKREIGFVFQDNALFENMSVEENLLYVKKDLTLAQHLLDVTQLTQLKNRLPKTLSGGQKQRVNLCRALMRKPKLLLMDEPLSALDIEMRHKLQDEILKLHQEFHTTTIMVSHEPSEIYKLSSRVLKLQNGSIVYDGGVREALLKQSGSAKFSFEGELLSIEKVDIIFIAIVAIGQQLVEVVLSSSEVENFSIGQRVHLSTKAFGVVMQSIG